MLFQTQHHQNSFTLNIQIRTFNIAIYHAFIRPKIYYGIADYSSASKKVLSSMIAIHHTTIQLAIGAFPTTPVISTIHEAEELSLNLYRQRSLLSFIRISINVPSYLSTSHSILTFTKQIQNIVCSLQIHLPRVFIPTLPSFLLHGAAILSE